MAGRAGRQHCDEQDFPCDEDWSDWSLCYGCHQWCWKYGGGLRLSCRWHCHVCVDARIGWASKSLIRSSPVQVVSSSAPSTIAATTTSASAMAATSSSASATASAAPRVSLRDWLAPSSEASITTDDAPVDRKERSKNKHNKFVFQ